VGEARVNAVAHEQGAEPIPAARGFDHRAMGAGQLAEITAQADRLIGERRLADDPAVLSGGGEHGRAAVLIDASVEHRRLQARGAARYTRSRLEGSHACSWRARGCAA
jgi:hypothetical protein